MSRDPWQLDVFRQSDELALRIYQATESFPANERFGLTSQIRRAAVSVPANIVEGSARWGPKEYLHFLNLAQGSASETRYFIHFCSRLGFLTPAVTEELWGGYDGVCRGLQALINKVKTFVAPPPNRRRT